MSAAGSIEVRPAVAADSDFILRAILALADYEKLSDQVVATESALREHLFGARPFAEVLIGELAGRRAGYALFFYSYSTFLALPGLFLEDLLVLPEARGKGLGRALLKAVAAQAVARGCGRLEWSVLDWNEPAIGFYRGLGARPVEGWTAYRLSGEALRAAAR